MRITHYLYCEMKNFCSVFSLVFFLPAVALGLSDWSTTNIDTRVRVQAPARLVIVDMSKAAALSSASESVKNEALEKSKTTKYFVAKGTDYVYSILRVDGGASGMPESIATNPKSLKEFYDSFANVITREDRGQVMKLFRKSAFG